MTTLDKHHLEKLENLEKIPRSMTTYDHLGQTPPRKARES